MKTGNEEGEKHMKTGDEEQGEKHKKSGEEGRQHKNTRIVKHDEWYDYLYFNEFKKPACFC